MTILACACMGKMYGEPYCPCEMDRRGIPSSDEHIRENAEAQIRWDSIDWTKYEADDLTPTGENGK